MRIIDNIFKTRMRDEWKLVIGQFRALFFSIAIDCICLLLTLKWNEEWNEERKDMLNKWRDIDDAYQIKYSHDSIFNRIKFLWIAINARIRVDQNNSGIFIMTFLFIFPGATNQSLIFLNWKPETFIFIP